MRVIRITRYAVPLRSRWPTFGLVDGGNALALYTGRWVIRIRTGWMMRPAGWRYALRHMSLLEAIRRRGHVPLERCT